MNEEKTLITFRVSNARKRQLDYLAQKAGKSVTQYLDLLLKGEIEQTLVIESHIAAIEKAAIEMGIDPKMANAIANSDDNSGKLNKIEAVLDDKERFKDFLDKFEKAWWQTLEARNSELEIETPLTGTRMDFYARRQYVKTY